MTRDGTAMTISPTSAEQDNQRLTDEHLETAVRTVRDAGFVILEDVLPEEWVATARDDYEEAYRDGWEAAVADDPDTEKGQGFQGIPGGIPLRAPFTDAFALANPWALQILDAAMGEDVYLQFPYGSNTAAPDADPGPQHVHRDEGAHLFPELPVSTPPTKMVVNVALTEFTPENGSTELWPGTHVVPDRDASDREQLGERAETMPSVRANMPAGSVVVRDMRMWHRGMPNRTDDLRIMLSPVYFRQLHHVPSGASAFSEPVPRSVWEDMSERARELCRYNPVEDRSGGGS